MLLVSCVDGKKKGDSTTTNDGEMDLVPAFSIQTIKKQYTDCEPVGDKPCIDVSIQYPNLSSSSFSNLNQSLKEHIIQYTSDFVVTEKPIERNEVHEFIKMSVDEKIQNIKQLEPSVFQLDIVIQPIFSNEEITTIQSDYFSFEGGAHPDHGSGFIIFENETGAILNDEVITKDVQMKQLLLKHIKEEENAQEKDLSEAGFLVTDLEFAVSDNIGVKKDSLLIIYSPYEIAPYSKGLLRYSFPRETVQSYLSPAFVDKWEGDETRTSK